MLIDLGDLIDFLRMFELWDFWKAARDAPEGSRLYRWRYVIRGVILVIVVLLALLLLLSLMALLLKA
ncbi:hypothetical protein [Pseudomonas viridiflava]|uniref:hypothetical protein n=1 Tax=Pseudomonas viridiflava TaxID=33069 RepID=UPI000F010C0B|nr:hypothetical protein [Pseudomonas viridiflava]MEE4227552.1 hypothetical protein [Pseudomonas viridiflava]